MAPSTTRGIVSLFSRARGRLASRGRDAGFTLMETIVSITLLGVVTTATTGFFINAIQTTNYLRMKQAAVQLVDDALEKARSLTASGVVQGRDQTSSNAQWAIGQANPMIKPYLNSMTQIWDTATNLLANSGLACALDTSLLSCLSTAPVTQTLNNLVYSTNTFVGTCRFDSATNGCDSVGTGIAYVRVVAAVTWQAKRCPSGGCTFVSTELLSNSSDPIFNLNAGLDVNLGTATSTFALRSVSSPQTSTAGQAVSLPLLYAGGVAPVTFKALTLPAGLQLDTSTGVLYGTPACASNPCTVAVTATDNSGAVSAVTFGWTVNNAPTVTAPTAGQVVQVDRGSAASIALTSSGGTGTPTWTSTLTAPSSCTSTYAGLCLSDSKIIGTPTAATTDTPVTVTATDASSALGTQRFTIHVNDPMTVDTPAAQYSYVGTTITPLQVAAHSGAGGYTYSAANLPSGVAIDANTGQITGTPTAASTKSTVVTVKDAAGVSIATTAFAWTTVAAFTVTNPGAQYANQNVAESVTIAGSGGFSGYVWNVTGLPTGLTWDPTTTGASLTIAGTPTTLGNNTVTATVTDSQGSTQTVSFAWNVYTGPQMVIPATQNTTRGFAASLQLSATGGSPTQTWTATNLPTGLTMSTAGKVTGTPPIYIGAANNYTVTVKVTDVGGASDTETFVWTVS